MKKFIFILTLIAVCTMTSVTAQHYIGIKGGWGGGSARFLPNKETGIEWGLPSGGISYKFYSNTKFVGGVQVDLQYLGRGFMYDIKKDSDTSYHRTITSIDLPIMWQPHAYIFHRNARVFLNLGVTFSYNLTSKEYMKSKKEGTFYERDYHFGVTRDNRVGYGLCGGAGLSIFIKRFEIAAEGRYYFGYSDILKNKTKYESNPLRSPLDNINISMALYYRLSKDGIRSAPSKSTARRMMEYEAKRTLKKLEKNGNREGIDTSTEDR